MRQFLKRVGVYKWKIAIAVVLLGGASIALFNESVADQPALLVTERDVVQYVQLSGEVTAVDEAELAFAVGGKVAAIEVVQGETVEAGQVLARLESARLEADLAQANGSVAAAEATVVAAEAALQKAESNLSFVQAQNRGIDASITSAHTALSLTETEQATLVANAYRELLNNDLQAYQTDAYRTLSAPVVSGSYHSDAAGEYKIEFYRSGARSGYSIRYSGLENGTASFDDFGLPVELGTRGLFVTLPVSGEGDSYGSSEWVVPVPNARSLSYQTKLSAYEKAQETEKQLVAQAEASLENLLAQQTVGEQSAITTAQEAQAQAAVAEAGANLLQAQASLQQARARVSMVEAQLADTVIIAPFAGIVASTDLTVGEIITTATPVMTLVSGDGHELRMNVPEIDIAKIDIGDEAKISLDAYGDMVVWSGKVTEIELTDTEVDGVPVYITTVTLTEPDKRIRIGMSARARIDIETVSQVVAVPASYILSTEEGVQVFVQREQGVDPRVVTLGLRGTDNYVVVTAGLVAGEYIVKPVRE